MTAATIDEASALLRDAPSPVVVVAVYNAFDDVVRCVEALVAHTPVEIGILIVDDGSADRQLVDVLDAVSTRLGNPVVILRRDQNGGYVRSCNDAFRITAPRDVVLVNSDVVVGAEWLARLRASALSDDTIATASTLTNHGSIVSVPDRNMPRAGLPDELSPDEAARRVAAGSHQLRPTIPTAIGHCVYIRRYALDLVGHFDETFSPGYGEEVDFSQRLVAHGLRHVCADDVFTYHRGGGSFGARADVRERQASHEAIVRRRYPWYGAWVQRAADDPASELADALATARRSLVGLTVGIDAMCLGPHEMGTQKYVVESVRSLARRSEIQRLVVFVPERLPRYAEDLRDQLPNVQFMSIDLLAWRADRLVDLVYRPYQVTRLIELDFLRTVADRFVVNQLDIIAFENPAYFDGEASWREYRDVTRLTLGMAHGVAFLSDHGRRSAAAAGLLGPGRTSAIVSSGVTSDVAPASPTCPASFATADDERFLLFLGASYLHKNRRFALELWAELRRRGWGGRIVLAGPTPPFGNSLAQEAEFLLGAPELRDDVVVLGPVTEAEKQWLYQHAALVLYPSSVEGFGLVPFEAAAEGVPTLATLRGSLAEVLPPAIPALVGFCVSSGADVAWALLHDDAAASELVDAVRTRSKSFTWDRTAERLVDLFTAALRQPRGRVLTYESEGDQPIGLPQRGASRRAADALEGLVSAVVSRPALKQALSPDGSRRQQAARTMISRARRSLG